MNLSSNLKFTRLAINGKSFSFSFYNTPHKKVVTFLGGIFGSDNVTVLKATDKNTHDKESTTISVRVEKAQRAGSDRQIKYFDRIRVKGISSEVAIVEINEAVKLLEK